MNNNEFLTINNETILNAIDSYEPYALSQRETLKVLLKVAINDISIVSVKYLMEKVKVSRARLYMVLKNLEAEGIIEKTRVPNSKYNAYKIIRRNLANIVELYMKKSSL
jgi:DNA-binding MarR family transcriptional regulator